MDVINNKDDVGKVKGISFFDGRESVDIERRGLIDPSALIASRITKL